jgi:hypothetical protein
MLVYTTPHAVRVEIVPGKIHCLIVTGADGVKDFYLINESFGDPVHMFSMQTANDTESAEIALANAADYIPPEWH